jgi:hypothetical protein
VLGFDEAAALLEPFDVSLVGDVVLDEHRHDQHEPDDECEAREVVHVLGDFRHHAERVVADQRQQQMLSEGDVQPCEA